MTNIIIGLTLLVSACSHKPTFFNQYKDRRLYIRKHFVTDRASAEKFIRNRQNFLNLIFKPSPHPLSEQPLLTPDCIKENQVGPVFKDNDTIMAVSTLYVDLYGNAGFCSDNINAVKVHSIYLYCERDHYILSFQFMYEPDFEEKVGNMEFCAI